MPTVYSPPVSTYVALATVTLTSTDSEIVFTSIPASYRDLILVFSGTTDAGAGIEYKLNDDATTSNYYYVQMYGTGSAAASSSGNSNDFIGVSTSESNAIVQFMDYSATDKHKTGLIRYAQTGGTVRALATRWASTAAINKITIYDSNAQRSFTTGSTFSLYGIEA